MPKRITRSKLIERDGIALIAQRVGEMEFVWHERQNDFGIDGEIEFRDPRTEAALNAVAFVQSKASDRLFPGETSDRFHYICREDDIAYWLGGNAPVILVCSHPRRREAWWVSIKDYFVTPERMATRRVEFDKRTQRFDASAAGELLRLAVPKASGLYFGPAPGPEHVTSNIVPVASFPGTIHWVQTSRDAREIRRRLHDAGTPAMDWIRRDGRIYSFRDLSCPPFDAVCEGPVGRMPASAWASSHDAAERFRFIDLLKHTLQEQLFCELSFHPGRRFFYFRATSDLRPRRIASGRSRNGVTVFREYTTDDEEKSYYFRHHAAEVRFVRFDARWFCEILPTYHFTSDGRQDSWVEAEALAGIKALERNEAVRRLVELWAHHLHERTTTASEVQVRLGRLLRFEFEREEGVSGAYPEAA